MAATHRIFSLISTALFFGTAIAADQPVTNLVTPLTSNPPLAQPLLFAPSTATPRTTFATLLTDAAAAGLVPQAVDQGFDNAYLQSWNLNVQREITPTLGLMVGYFGSKGTHLRISRNLNQLVSRVRPFPTLSSSSPILPGAALGNITQSASLGNSSYNALWVTGNKRLSHGLQFNASYTFSKSIDYNSLNSQGIAVQDSFNIRGDRGLSDFDARHRFVINWLYELPFRGNRLVEGWQLSAITQWQTGNPLNVLSNVTFTGLATLRPDLIGPITYLNDPSLWFNNSVCDPRVTNPCPAGTVFAVPTSSSGVLHFGNLGRNVLIGPGFSNTDFSLLKNTRITERLRVQFRTEFFNIFNHPNFGQPGRIATVGSINFGVIRNTRFPTGDSGTSRQVQFALKFIF